MSSPVFFRECYCKGSTIAYIGTVFFYIHLGNIDRKNVELLLLLWIHLYLATFMIMIIIVIII